MFFYFWAKLPLKSGVVKHRSSFFTISSITISDTAFTGLPHVFYI